MNKSLKYGLRKLSIGVSSCFLGSVILAAPLTISAEDAATTDVPAETTNTPADTQNADDTAAQQDAGQNAGETKPTTPDELGIIGLDVAYENWKPGDEYGTTIISVPDIQNAEAYLKAADVNGYRFVRWEKYRRDNGLLAYRPIYELIETTEQYENKQQPTKSSEIVNTDVQTSANALVGLLTSASVFMSGAIIRKKK